MIEVVYDVHGVMLRLRSNDAGVLESVDRRLRWFRTSSPLAGPVMSVRTGVEPSELPRQPSGEWRAVYDTPVGPVFYHEGVDSLWLDYDGWASLLIEPGVGNVRLWSVATGAEAVWLLSHPLLTIALTETMKRRARYPLHAAALLPSRGDVMVFAGGSGAGKSTLAVALLDQGWGFLADDTVFLRRDGASLTVLGFADEVDVSDDTLSFLPVLTPGPDALSVAGRGKWPVIVEEAFGIVPVTSGRVGAVVFPAVGREARSVLTRLDPGEALVELAPNVLLTEPASSQAHFDALGALVQDAPSWRLATGRDFRHLAAVLADLRSDLSAPPPSQR